MGLSLGENNMLYASQASKLATAAAERVAEREAAMQKVAEDAATAEIQKYLPELEAAITKQANDAYVSFTWEFPDELDKGDNLNIKMLKQVLKEAGYKVENIYDGNFNGFDISWGHA